MTKTSLLTELNFPVLITRAGKMRFKNEAAKQMFPSPRMGAAFRPYAELVKGKDAQDAEAWKGNGILLPLTIRGEYRPAWVIPVVYEEETAEGWIFLPELAEGRFAEQLAITEFALQTVAAPFGEVISALSKPAQNAAALRQFHRFYIQKQQAERLLSDDALAVPHFGGRHKLSLFTWLSRSLSQAIAEIGGSLTYQDDAKAPLSASYADHRRYSAMILRACTFLFALSEDGRLSICGSAKGNSGSLLFRICTRKLPKEADGFSGDLLHFVSELFPAEYPMFFLQELLSASGEISFTEAGVQVEEDAMTLFLPFTLAEVDLLREPMEMDAADSAEEAAILLRDLLLLLGLRPKATAEA